MVLDGSLQDIQEECFLPTQNVSVDSRCLPTQEHNEVNFEIWKETKIHCCSGEQPQLYLSHFFNEQISSLSHSHCPVFHLGLNSPRTVVSDLQSTAWVWISLLSSAPAWRVEWNPSSQLLHRAAGEADELMNTKELWRGESTTHTLFQKQMSTQNKNLKSRRNFYVECLISSLFLRA